jgi:Tat protein translocase TatB subunit
MFGMGMGELIVILIVALLVMGPDKLPDAAKAIGKGLRELRKHTNDLQETIENDETIGGAIREVRGALRGEEPAASIRPAARKALKKAAAPAAPAAEVVKPDAPAPEPSPPIAESEPETVPQTPRVAAGGDPPQGT